MVDESNKYKEILNEMPSLKKLYYDMHTAKMFRIILSEENSKQLKEQVEKLDTLLETFYKYNLYFSDRGWILYGNLNIDFANECILEFEKNGLEKAEEKIVNYYLNNDGKKFYFKSSLFKNRNQLIKQGLEAHFNGDFYKSVPLFLIIADSIVNEYTKAKGFFSDNVDLSCWDSIVGLTSGLLKIKDIYNCSRKKTNYDEIRFPYRNGILHGRDLNFANKYVSCKSLVLLLALDNWIIDKESEEKRKEKYDKDCNPPSIRESLQNLKKIEEKRKLIKSYEKREYIINIDFPENGSIDDYTIDFIKPVISIYDFWKKRNYGFLTELLNRCLYGKNKNEKIELCKEMFGTKEVKSFRISKINDYTISMKKISIEFDYNQYGLFYTQKYEIGVIYYDNDVINIPNFENGKWEISYIKKIIN